jgi:hypothetical protein
LQHVQWFRGYHISLLACFDGLRHPLRRACSTVNWRRLWQLR